MENILTGEVGLPKLSFLDDFAEPKELSAEEIEQEEKEREERVKQFEIEQEKIRKAELLKYYKTESGVNQRYWEESLDSYIAVTEEEKKNLDYARKFCKGETKPMLLLIGKFGTGKTHIGCGIVRETKGVFISSFELCVRYEMGSDYKADMNRLEVLKKYSSVRLLVIDEIGRGKTDVEKQILPYIINERYERMLPTVLITNLEKGLLLDLLGSATVDRLKEVCSTLTFNGKSRRSEIEKV